MKTVLGSIVTFNPQWDLLQKTIESFLNTTSDSLVVVWDNSELDTISTRLKDFGSRVVYLKSPKNLGYGKGNNEVFERYKDQAKYFCVLNPDLELPENSVPQLLAFMEKHPQWELVTGAICNPKGNVDPVHKKLPTFRDYAISFAARKLLRWQLDKKNNQAFLSLLKSPCRLPILSGCFLLFTSKHYKDLGGFDERFFLYFEDWDLSLRSYLQGKSLILPQIPIQHAWGRQSHKKFAIFLLHLRSAFTFYMKWGFGGKVAKLVNSSSGYFNPDNKATNIMKDI